MSDLIKTKQIENSKDCPTASVKPVRQKLNTRMAQLGENITIHRALPHRDRKMIGAWCFLDHFGPIDLTNSSGLNIAPHPHIGLQTFTWILAGEIRHRDSLGSNQIIQPGQINLMTAGIGISHSEESIHDTVLHGVQLWIALPDTVRHKEPNFIHYPTVPTLIVDGLQIHLLAGEFLDTVSPTHVHSPLVGIDVDTMENTSTTLPLNPQFEYGILPLIGCVEIENDSIGTDSFMYLGCGRTNLSITADTGSRFLIIGGKPFKEEILIWWNFVARTKEEMIRAAAAWENHTDFGEVMGYEGGRLSAPVLN